MPGQKSNARQVSSLGETPVEARRRMIEESHAGVDAPSPHIETAAMPSQHIAAMREQEGFTAPPVTDGTTEDAEETTEPPTPSKAMAMIRQLGQEKLQLLTERDAALNVVERYKVKYGEVD